MQSLKSKLLIIFLLSGLTYKTQAQTSGNLSTPADSSLILNALGQPQLKKRHIRTIKRIKNPLTLPMVGAMWFYQKAVSPQLSANCSYSPSCSNFALLCIEKYGWMKGTILAADRLTRCSRPGIHDLPKNTPRTKDGHILDLPQNYARHK